jgi:1-acyl-sn-glycerol-3-phosphate acyltransferase
MRGLTTIFFAFPRIGEEAKRLRIRRWCERLLAILGVETRMRGLSPDAVPSNVLQVANHISWLDIFVILSVRATRFVGKSELGTWPLLRHLILGTGTILIDRNRRRDTARINTTVSDVLRNGDCVSIFPEGTTSDGRRVLHFHASLLQPALDAGAKIAPVALSYRNAHGEHSDSPIYIGETTFLQSLWWILGERRLRVEVHFLPPIDAQAEGNHRRHIASAAQREIADALRLPNDQRR